MKNYRLSTRTLAAAVGLLSISGAMAQQQINVVVNGKLVAFDNVGPREVRGRVLVPLRGVLEELGAYVGWDQTTRTVSATKGNLDMKLMIGSRTASVNGSNVPLDVPAEVYDGSTMVPLRFVSETLGANVQWLQASNTVQIDAPMTESYRSTAPPTTTAVNAAPVKISTFSADHTGFFPSASNITFTMIGTPGGKATFQIPGVTGEIPMQETQPGTYVGQWMPPAASDQGFEMSSTTAIGHLIVGSSDQATVTNATFSIDTRPPHIVSMRPNQDGQVGPRPRIVAHFDDGAGSGIDPSTVQVTLDGADVTNAANVTASGIDFRPGSELAAGSHNVALSVKDKAGNQATTNWTFMAAENRSVARSLRFTALPVYDAGKEIQVTLDADPGATATFSIGGRHREIPMHESSPGHYVGHYTVKEGDYFNNESVRAHLHTSDGKDYSVDADDRLGVQSIEMRQPHLVSPKENEQVNSPLILKGTAAPYSTVMVHVAYSALVFANQVRVHGTLGDFTVTADQNGYFQTPIDLGRIHGANKRYQITAWSIDSNGKKSEQSTLNVFQ